MPDKENQAPQIADVFSKNDPADNKDAENALSSAPGNTLAEDADKLDNLAETTKEENIQAWEEKLGKKLTAGGNQQELTQSARQ